VLLAIVSFVVVVGGFAVRLAGVRDVGSSVLPDRDAALARTSLLGSPVGLAVRLERPVALGWAAALAFLGLVFGLVAQSAANAVSGSDSVEKALSRLGGHHGGAAAYLGLTFLIVATLVALAGAGQVTAAGEEEAEGRLDNLLVRPVARRTWPWGRLAVATAIVVVSGLVAGLLAWVGATSQHSGVSFRSLMEANVNTAPPALLLLGVGALVHAARPRLVAAVVYGLIAWSFLVEFLGSIIKTTHWLLDTSILYHVAPAPATSPHWASAAILIGLGLLSSAVATAIFERRDLISA
jgi:ABC-2 type transport system permease protein